MNKNLLIGGGVVVGVIVVAAGAFVAAVTMQPDTIHVERTALIEATPADIHPMINDFKGFVQWSPWSELDPDQTVEFSDPSSGQGAWYTWKGNDKVGSGKMTITASTDMRVEQDLEFKEPWVANADVVLAMSAEGDKTKVTWSMDQEADFMAKAMTLFMDMDAMVGKDFDSGLAKLNTVATEAKTARVAAEAAEAERLAAEQAAAEAAAAEGMDGVEGAEGTVEGAAAQ